MSTLIIILILVLLPVFSYQHDHECTMFNFGDSNADTGGAMTGFGEYVGPPNGNTFSHKLTGHSYDGRLYIDFISEALKIKYLSPYLESFGSDFSHGANFAIYKAGTDALGIGIALWMQINQFIHFQNYTRELRPDGSHFKSYFRFQGKCLEVHKIYIYLN
ncbi:hypothetical protein Cgig2_011131 [Carnegiea gigantea]|uniref:GDSL esterase/lipase n=1 Tax=Carnegiea gigantea TaxID=171969 RepID=A0A9Q1GK67_9CARY|nr:hypothetical protein Cgig2_011131 [Carnegiea gigantea]